MSKALEQAQKAYDNGQFPVGCVIENKGKIIASGTRNGTDSSTGFFSETDHAEIRALKNLEQSNKGFNLERAVLYSTMEPCLMCFGAIILSGIKKIVYAYEDPMGGGTNCNLASLKPLYNNCRIEIVPGILRQKSLDLFYNFFNKENNLYWKNSLLEKYTLKQIKDAS